MGDISAPREIVRTRAFRRGELFPAHPERVCWGCDRYCSADDLACGNGTIRTPHPRELFGDDWMSEDETQREGIALDAPRS
jgi:hypothetical protein